MSPARRSVVRLPFAAFACLLLAAACSLSPHPDLPGAENDLGNIPGSGGALGAGGAPYTGGAATGGVGCEDPLLEPPACDAQGGQGGSDGNAGGGGR